MVIKLVVTFIYFWWPKCFAVGDAINACLPLEEATHTAKDDSHMTSGPVATGRLGCCCWGRGCGGQGGKYCWDREDNPHRSIRWCSKGASPCPRSPPVASQLCRRLLSFQQQRLLHIGISITQPAQKPWVVWVHSVLWEEKQIKTGKEKGSTGKILLLTFSPGFSSLFLYVWSVATGWSKFQTCWLPSSCIFWNSHILHNSVPFYGDFSSVGSPRALCLLWRMAGLARTCQSWLTTSTLLICSGPLYGHGKWRRDEELSAANPGCSTQMKVTHQETTGAYEYHRTVSHRKVSKLLSIRGHSTFAQAQICKVFCFFFFFKCLLTFTEYTQWILNKGLMFPKSLPITALQMPLCVVTFKNFFFKGHAVYAA